MTYKLLDGVQQFATGAGTGPLALGPPTTSSFRTLIVAGLQAGDTSRVRIEQADDLGQWEVVSITLNNDGTITRTFDTLSLSATGALINFSGGDKVVSSVVVAEDLFTAEMGEALFDAVAEVEAAMGDTQAAQDSAYQAQAHELGAEAAALDARLSAAQFFPSDFVGDSKFWTEGQGQAGSPTQAVDNPLRGGFVDIAGEGRVYRTEASPQTCNSFGPIGAIAAVPGTRIEMRARVRAITDNTGGTPTRAGLATILLAADFNYTSFVQGVALASSTVANGWQEIALDVTLPAPDGVTAYVRPSLFYNVVGNATDPIAGSNDPQGNQQFEIAWFTTVVTLPATSPLPRIYSLVGSGAYNPVCSFVKVTMKGGGAGGGGGGGGDTATDGADGVNTTFGAWIAGGGKAGKGFKTSAGFGQGGLGGINTGGGVSYVDRPGGAGGNGPGGYTFAAGGAGGGGQPGEQGGTAIAAPAGSGCGGPGGGADATAGPGGGGGEGGELTFYIAVTGAPIAYAVGGGGAHGNAGGGGTNGTDGSSGSIAVEEWP